MKSKLITSIFLLLMMSFSVQGQEGFSQSVEKRLLNGVDSTVFVLEMDRAIEHDVKKAWEKTIKVNRKIKPVVENDLIIISGITVSSIDESPIDIYASIIQQETSVKLYATYIVDSVRVDPNGNEGTSVKIRKSLAKFGANVYSEVLQRELEEKQAKLDALIKSRDKNLKEQDNIEKSIQRDSLKIGSAETEIALQSGQLKGATERYTVQKNKMATLKHAEKEQIKEEKSKLKGLDKERKGIEKDIEKESDKILDLKSEIRDHWFELKQLKEDLDKIESEITEQRIVVQAAEKALESN